MFPILLAALTLSAPVPKPTPIDLSWKFTKGDVFYVRYELAQCSSERGEYISVGLATTTVLVGKVTVAAADEKQTELEFMFEPCKYGTGGGSEGVSFKEIGELTGKVVKFTLNAKGNVTGVKGTDKLPDREHLSEQALGLMMQTLTRSVPGEPIIKGDKWVDEWERQTSEVTALKKSMRGTLTDVTDRIAELSVETDYSERCKRKGEEYELKAEKETIRMKFDVSARRMRELEEKYTLVGEVKRLDGTNIRHFNVGVKLTVTDEKPKAKK